MMEHDILKLEKRLFEHKYISNEKWLNEVLHKNFKECGKSGYIFNQKGTIKYLLSCDGDRKIDIYNYECKSIDENTWMVHYITIGNNKNYFRTSIWVMEENLKLIFHQASILNEKIELKRF